MENGEWTQAIAADEVAEGHVVAVTIGDHNIAIYHIQGGEFHATSNICIHRGGPLGQGLLEGHAVMCPWHAWTWDVRTGENTANPGLAIPTFEVKVEGGDVLVQIPD